MNALPTPEDGRINDEWDDLLGCACAEFDALILQEVDRRRRAGAPVSVLDSDCGRGELAVRLAQAGAQVTALVDQEQGSLGRTSRALLETDLPIRFLARGSEQLPGAPFDLVLCRRSLPFLRYADAVRHVARLNAMLKIGGKLYVATFGLHSLLGDAYPDADKSVQQRFAPLPDALAQRYGIAGPICLYTERDLFVLLFEAGNGVLKSFTTTHGSVKVIGVRV